MKTIFLWFKVIRPNTLLLSVCPVVMAYILATNESILLPQSSGIFWITLFCAISIQTFCNLVNDYWDYKRGTDLPGREGPQRPLAEGLVNIKQMRNAILITLSIAVILGAILIGIGGLTILYIGIASLIVAWLYTATRYSLAYLGIADLFVLVFFGILPVCGTYYLLTNDCLFCMPKILWVSFAVGMITVLVLMVNNLRDIDGDKQSNKKTLPVRFGKTFGLILFWACCLSVPVFVYLAFGLQIPVLIGLFTIILAIEVLIYKGKKLNQTLGHCVLTNIVFLILVLIHYLIK